MMKMVSGFSVYAFQRGVKLLERIVIGYEIESRPVLTRGDEVLPFIKFQREEVTKIYSNNYSLFFTCQCYIANILVDT